MEELKVGDVVRLKSGGGEMTVEAINSSIVNLVYWWSGELKHTDVSSKESLEICRDK